MGILLILRIVNSPALRGFMRKVRWNDGLGLGEDTRNCAVN